MAVLVLLVLFMALTVGSDATWCVCRTDVGDSSLQKTLDYACGAGADCSPILQNGACYQPNTIKAHCSYAANSYFQRKGQAAGSCDFSGTAVATNTDPSVSSCSYPSTASSAGTGTTTPTTSTNTPTSTNPTGATPNTFTTPTGNGVLGGLGPSGTSISTDGSGGGLLPRAGGMGSLFLALMLSVLGLVFSRGG